MALKKRGFNVDRMLNQQREERLRLQAEAVRDREKTKSTEDAKASSMIPWPGSPSKGGSTTGEDTASLLSNESQSTGTAVASDSGGKSKFWDKIKNRRSSDKGGGLTMPGAMPGMPSMSDIGSGSVLGGMLSELRGAGARGSGSGGGGPGTSTKRVSSEVSLHNQKKRIKLTDSQPTDLQSIRSTVQKALDASRPETSTHIQDSRMGATAVSESQSDYCDTTASADIVLALDPGSAALKLWIPRGELRK